MIVKVVLNELILVRLEVVIKLYVDMFIYCF